MQADVTRAGRRQMCTTVESTKEAIKSRFVSVSVHASEVAHENYSGIYRSTVACVLSVDIETSNGTV